MLVQLGEEVPEDGVAVDLVGFTHEMPSGEIAVPGEIISESGGGEYLGRDPVRVQQLRDVDQIPDDLGASYMVSGTAQGMEGIVPVEPVEIVSDRASPADPGFDIWQGELELRTDVVPRQVDVRHAALKDELRGRNILFEIE